jgi:mRNA-degrading endonuclease YafQ of YafQ-DinJ toxin-antitoxin module
MTAKPGGSRLTLVWTATFVRTTRKFLRRHPDLEGLFEDVLRQLETDPQAPRLRLHPLQGKHRGKHAVSLTYEHRIVLILRLAAGEIVLLDVGTHDDVYRG